MGMNEKQDILAKTLSLVKFSSKNVSQKLFREKKYNLQKKGLKKPCLTKQELGSILMSALKHLVQGFSTCGPQWFF